MMGHCKCGNNDRCAYPFFCFNGPGIECTTIEDCKNLGGDSDACTAGLCKCGVNDKCSIDDTCSDGQCKEINYHGVPPALPPVPPSVSPTPRPLDELLAEDSIDDRECKDRELWCAYSPDCSNEDVKSACPKHCSTCQDTCVDLEDFCHYNPDCAIAQVKSQCPKLCNVCDTGYGPGSAPPLPPVPPPLPLPTAQNLGGIGDLCTLWSDCLSAECENGRCVEPTCDGKKCPKGQFCFQFSCIDHIPPPTSDDIPPPPPSDY
jgi:hypothetical protein